MLLFLALLIDHYAFPVDYILLLKHV